MSSYYPDIDNIYNKLINLQDKLNHFKENYINLVEENLTLKNNIDQLITKTNDYEKNLLPKLETYENKIKTIENEIINKNKIIEEQNNYIEELKINYEKLKNKNSCNNEKFLKLKQNITDLITEIDNILIQLQE